MILRPLARSAFHGPSLAIPRTLAAPLSRTSLRRPVLIAFGLTSAIVPLLPFGPAVRLDASPAADFSSAPYTHSRDAKTPLTRNGRTLNPAAVKQISLGSILGLGLGLVVSAFSTSLTLLLGLGIVGWQLAARKGYNFIPVDRLQKYVTSVDLRSAINDNLAFKISFGLMFALSAFGEF
jgi:uncharacterized membrane protein (Fun14 family)